MLQFLSLEIAIVLVQGQPTLFSPFQLIIIGSVYCGSLSTALTDLWLYSYIIQWFLFSFMCNCSFGHKRPLIDALQRATFSNVCFAGCSWDRRITIRQVWININYNIHSINKTAAVF